MSQDPKEPAAPTAEAADRFRNVAIRRSQGTSFGIGVAVVFVALLLAVGVCALLMWLLAKISAVAIILIFGVTWFGVFFASIPLQRRYARALDGRKPGVSLSPGMLTVPVKPGSTLVFWTHQPIEVAFGWLEFISQGGGGPTSQTRTVMSWATLSQAGQHVILQAEDSIKAAQKAGWQKATSPLAGATKIRLWECDLVELAEYLKARR